MVELAHAFILPPTTGGLAFCEREEARAMADVIADLRQQRQIIACHMLNTTGRDGAACAEAKPGCDIDTEEAEVRGGFLKRLGEGPVRVVSAGERLRSGRARVSRPRCRAR